MSLAALVLGWTLGVGAYFELGEAGGGLDEATVSISGRDFVPLRDPKRPTSPWREARDADRIRYRVLIERGLEAEAVGLIAKLRETLGDPAGWAAAGREFAAVDAHEQFKIVLARPSTVDRLCAPLKTAGVYSCGRGGRATLNLDRWRGGCGPWGDEIDGYRGYMINHEVGHLLGMPHQKCGAPGEPAAVMVQQTISLGGCLPSPVPDADEVARLRARWDARGR